jgi:hypothetical protein
LAEGIRKECQVATRFRLEFMNNEEDIQRQGR